MSKELHTFEEAMYHWAVCDWKRINNGTSEQRRDENAFAQQINRLLDSLHRSGRLSWEHVEALRQYSLEAQRPLRALGEHEDSDLWEQARDVIYPLLLRMGLIVPREVTGENVLMFKRAGGKS